ncbi:MAG TPA: metallophosphoesterase family protein [Anaerolineae bacterium]|nr:metallophosphoesterase family protein [Anaerolineae bacterium]
MSESLSYLDPRGDTREDECGLTPTRLIAFAKAQGWPVRKIYGRHWISATHYRQWVATLNRPLTRTWNDLSWRLQQQAIGRYPTFNVCGHYHNEFVYTLDKYFNLVSRELIGGTDETADRQN